MMNVYQKLAKARVELQEKSLNKSGENQIVKFRYFELSDFIVDMNEIFNRLGLCSVINYHKENATLTLINAEKPEEQIQFTSPMPSNLETILFKSSSMQSIGAVQTYQRRYLYLTALEIVENDQLDSVAEQQLTNPPPAKPRNEQLLEKFKATLQSITNLDQLHEKWISSEPYFKDNYPTCSQAAYQIFLNRYNELGGK